MKVPDQVYKTHIKSTPEKVWNAITNPEFTKQYWFGNANVAAKWEKGATWEHKGMDSGTVYHSGIIEESFPNKRLVLSWGNPGDEVDVSRVTFMIEAKDDGVELTIIHGDFVEGSAMATRVSNGWPKVIANMKEFLDQGQVLAHSANCACA